MALELYRPPLLSPLGLDFVNFHRVRRHFPVALQIQIKITILKRKEKAFKGGLREVSDCGQIEMTRVGGFSLEILVTY